MALRKFLYMDQDTDGFPIEQLPEDSLLLGALTMSGDIDMVGSELIGLPVTPTASDAAASKAYVDSLLSGLKWQDPVQVLDVLSDADAGGTPPGAPTAGDSYVVNNWGGGHNDGDIVQWDGGAWVVVTANSGGEPPNGTRIVVAPSGAAGSFAGEENKIATYDAAGDVWTFLDPSEGTATLVVGDGAENENVSFTYDENTTSWVQFTGAGQILAGLGLTKDGNTIEVGNGDGIALGADSVGVDLDTDPGLEFNGVSPDGKLRVMTDSAWGIERSSTGLRLKIDETPDTLDVDANGLKVAGVPTLFKIDGTPVSSNVTANAVSDLVDGGNADSHHTHTVTAVEESQRVEGTHENNVSVSSGQAVRWSSTNNQITPADNNSQANARVMGVARVGGGISPGVSEVVKSGPCPGVLSGASANVPYFLGTNGAIVPFASIPLPGRVQLVGYAMNATDLDVKFHDYGLRRS